MRALGIKQALRIKYSEYAKCFGQSHRFPDLLGMVASFMPIPSKSIPRIQTTYSDADRSPTNWSEGFYVIHGRPKRLKLFGTGSRKLIRLRLSYEYIEAKVE